MMADQISFLLFGDQSLDTHGFLADFLRKGDPSVLAREFITQAGDALKDEIESLPRVERWKIPTFRTLPQLNEGYHGRAVKFPGIDSALLCIAQLAHYLEYVDLVVDFQLAVLSLTLPKPLREET